MNHRRFSEHVQLLTVVRCMQRIISAAVAMLICSSESGVLIGLYVSFLLGSNLKIAGLHFVLNILINFSIIIFHFPLLT